MYCTSNLMFKRDVTEIQPWVKIQPHIDQLGSCEQPYRLSRGRGPDGGFAGRHS